MGALHVRTVICLLLVFVSFAASADPLSSWRDFRGRKHHTSTVKVPSEIYDACLGSYGASAAANRCMDRNSGYRQKARRIMAQNPGLGANAVYQSCVAKYGADDMDTVRHCVQAEMNYRRIFGS